MNLGEFLREAGAKSREAGVWDCATFPAAWTVARGYPDPLRQWRGAYADEAGARDLIASHGGLEALFSAGMADAGVPEATGEPEPGDVAVLRALGEKAGSIYTGERWALIGDRGLVVVELGPRFVVRKWRVGNG